MCYHTKLNAKIREIEKTFDAQFVDPDVYSPRDEINAFDFSRAPVVIDESPGEINMFNWGLIPFWVKDDKIKKATLNAKIETATEKPAFRNSAGNRCLTIANGFYEWKWLDPKGKQKQKYLVHPTDQEIFAFAGIYSTWKDPSSNEVINSYSILTTEANKLMSEIHNNKKRMPVVLRRKDWSNWLSGNEISNFAFPYEVNLTARPI